MNTQRQEIELALLCRGEYKLREQFKFIEVSPQQWSKTQERQKTKALEKVHPVTLEQVSCSLTASSLQPPAAVGHATDYHPPPSNASNYYCQRVAFPSPNIGEFHIYLMQFCPSHTSKCFGCGNPLKANNAPELPPNDLVIVSKMLREWSYQGTSQSKMANVYFHCNQSCVARKQSGFQGLTCSIPQQIKPHLLEVHAAYLREHLGISRI